ncbi:leucine-rich repeat extensin-like protein 5 [Microtus oregoni]|uniref:leucine-rich repeat extensin-like protein 5 n=1 Tax=Microtus oregoni TaxID=111838 RepID=UPI001BB297FF|nr:leucine-rich repeat extensin-like protein 5 [Microtus oregoni]
MSKVSTLAGCARSTERAGRLVSAPTEGGSPGTTASPVAPREPGSAPTPGAPSGASPSPPTRRSSGGDPDTPLAVSGWRPAAPGNASSPGLWASVSALSCPEQFSAVKRVPSFPNTGFLLVSSGGCALDWKTK